jgi:hypothetical protein
MITVRNELKYAGRGLHSRSCSAGCLYFSCIPTMLETSIFEFLALFCNYFHFVLFF